MDAIAYNYAWATYEQETHIEYDFTALEISLYFPKSLYKNLIGLTLVCGGVLAVVTIPTPALAQYVQRGMSGDQVTQVQTLLRNRGYRILFGPEGAGQGRFGPQTEQAVKAFQRSVGLTVDGIVGPRTLQALQGGTGGQTTPNPPTTPSTSGGILRLGAKGSSVENVQTLLRNRGYSIRYGNGATYGVFDQATLQAVRQFQAKMGLAVDGIVGPRTWAALQGKTTPSNTASTAKTPPTPNNASQGRPGSYQVTTGGRGLNIRSGPGTAYPVVGSVADNSTVTVTAFPNSYWAQIGPGRFVSSGYIRPR